MLRMQLEYARKELFLGITLSPENRASPSSITRDMIWLLRSMDRSLRERQARKDCPILKPPTFTYDTDHSTQGADLKI